MVTQQSQWSHPPPLDVVSGSLAAVKEAEAGPAIITYGKGHSLKGLRPSISSQLRDCERLPARAVRAVGTTLGPAGTMQDGTLCMLVVYGRRMPPAGPAAASPTGPDSTATDRPADPAELRAAGGLGQSFLPSDSAQQGGPQPALQLTQAPAQQAAGQAGAGHEGASPELSNSPAPALNPTPHPAPASANNGGMELGSDAPTSVHHNRTVSSDVDDELQMPAPLLPGGPATTERQLQASGMDVEGSTPELAQAGHSEGYIPQSVVHPAVPHPVPTAVPHVVPAVLPPAGEECQLPAHFAESYGIRSTKVLTTRQAPAWWVPGPLLRDMMHKKYGPSLFHCIAPKG
jgi:hypothetical protein